MIYSIPLEKKEIAYFKVVVQVEANCKEDAFSSIRDIIDADTFEANFDTRNRELITTLDSSFIEKDCYSLDDTLENIQEVALPTVDLKLTAFDIARYGQDELYNIANSTYFRMHEINIDIQDMELIPICADIEDPEYVVYEVKATRYTLES